MAVDQQGSFNASLKRRKLEDESVGEIKLAFKVDASPHHVYSLLLAQVDESGSVGNGFFRLENISLIPNSKLVQKVLNWNGKHEATMTTELNPEKGSSQTKLLFSLTNVPISLYDETYNKLNEIFWSKLPLATTEHRPALHQRHQSKLPQEVTVTLSPSEYISNYLRSIPALSIISKEQRGNVAVVKANHHANKALFTMLKEDVLSCPVYDDELEGYIGFVDYLDVVSLIVEIVRMLHQEHFGETPLNQLNAEQQNMLVKLAQSDFLAKTLFDISGLSHCDQFIPIQKSANLLQAIEILSRFGYHRAPIIDDEGSEIIAILSQSDVVRFLYSNLDLFASKSKKEVKELIGVNPKPVVCVDLNAMVFEAFELMIKNKISAVAITNERGQVVGVISATDVRRIGIHAHTLGVIFDSVAIFLEQIKDLNQCTLPEVVKVSTSDTLGIAITKMDDNQVHRVLVTDQDNKPISVLSMRDVLMVFLS